MLEVDQKLKVLNAMLAGLDDPKILDRIIAKVCSMVTGAEPIDPGVPVKAAPAYRKMYCGNVFYKGRKYSNLKVLCDELGLASDYSKISKRRSAGEDVVLVLDEYLKPLKKYSPPLAMGPSDSNGF